MGWVVGDERKREDQKQRQEERKKNNNRRSCRPGQQQLSQLGRRGGSPFGFLFVWHNNAFAGVSQMPLLVFIISSISRPRLTIPSQIVGGNLDIYKQFCIRGSPHDYLGTLLIPKRCIQLIFV